MREGTGDWRRGRRLSLSWAPNEARFSGNGVGDRGGWPSATIGGGSVRMRGSLGGSFRGITGATGLTAGEGDRIGRPLPTEIGRATC